MNLSSECPVGNVCNLADPQRPSCGQDIRYRDPLLTAEKLCPQVPLNEIDRIIKLDPDVLSTGTRKLWLASFNLEAGLCSLIPPAEAEEHFDKAETLLEEVREVGWMEFAYDISAEQLYAHAAAFRKRRFNALSWSEEDDREIDEQLAALMEKQRQTLSDPVRFGALCKLAVRQLCIAAGVDDTWPCSLRETGGRQAFQRFNHDYYILGKAADKFPIKTGFDYDTRSRIHKGGLKLSYSWLLKNAWQDAFSEDLEKTQLRKVAEDSFDWLVRDVRGEDLAEEEEVMLSAMVTLLAKVIMGRARDLQFKFSSRTHFDML